MYGGFGVEGVEHGFEVIRELLESFLVCGDDNISHLFIPHFCK